MVTRPVSVKIGHDQKDGKFHEWGVDFEEFENGPGQYTVAIIELLDGTVITALPKNVRFTDVR